ncbi:c-type cytochrome [Tenacibaculum caenipelagi]|uniref:Nitric oxide reductase subunit C n=1 Tax=Tenacibaculum caenipelagi TaxID=1325435 RepID=A0A4V3D2X5_9FLAO|nr:cytochrome c [Tenacibaculum caenipelagi]TDQ25400.1 nitric oxide reductase subunit C [Tenacibaculum caenipelagi]
MNIRKNIAVIGVLITFFCFYNFLIYTSKEKETPVKLSKKAIKGQKIWQDNNCWSCHQVYGLGGYLGPDLTNIYSTKDSNYIKAMLNSGIQSMPKFSFTEEDKEAIVAYLKTIDSTGYYPNYEAIIKPNGWVELKYKDEK